MHFEIVGSGVSDLILRGSENKQFDIMPGGKGKSKGKKKLKKSNNCKGTEQEDMPAQSCGLEDENVLSMPIKKDTLATEFSNSCSFSSPASLEDEM